MLDTLPSGGRPHANELKMATQLIESMATPWRPRDFRDTYARKVHKLIEDKRNGREIVVEAEPPAATEVTDLMEVLRRSVEGAGKRRKTGAGNRSRPARVEVNGASKTELARAARELGIRGRSKMDREELAAAVKRENRKAS